MSNMAMMERMGMGMPTMPATGAPTPSMPNMNMMMVPRCTITMERCQGGMKMNLATGEGSWTGYWLSLSVTIAGANEGTAKRAATQCGHRVQNGVRCYVRNFS